MILTKITAFHEQELRQRANQNSKMKFLNVSTSGLRGKHHPVLSNVVTTSEVRSLRPVIKCLTGDYYCFSVKAAQTPGVSGHCRICPLQGETDMVTEDIVHVISSCVGTREVREEMLENVAQAVTTTKYPIDFQLICSDPSTLTQFLLDNTSMNLQSTCRVNINDSASQEIFTQARRMIAAIHAERVRKLKEIKNTSI